MARSNAERFEMGSRMFDAARNMLLASLLETPSERERRRLLFERVYGILLAFFREKSTQPTLQGQMRLGSSLFSVGKVS